jgi:Putative death-receptor fusion protein (DUF2428)
VKWRMIHNRIVAACELIWLQGKPVLCVDSPEGHSEESIDDLAVAPKDFFSYSWRALRESRYEEVPFKKLDVTTNSVAYYFMQL